jgi:hypothetical protein
MRASKAGIVGVSSLIAGRRVQEQNTGNLPSTLREAAFERATVLRLDAIDRERCHRYRDGDQQPSGNAQIFAVPKVMAGQGERNRVNDGASGERATAHLRKCHGREDAHGTDDDQGARIPKQMRSVEFGGRGRSVEGDLLDKNARSRSKSAALITPAFAATRRSPSEYAIAVSPVFHLPPRGLISARFGARTEPVIAVRQSSVQRILNNVKLFKHCSHISLRSYRPRAATGGRIGSGL